MFYESVEVWHEKDELWMTLSGYVKCLRNCMRIYEFCVSIWNLNYIENFVIVSLTCYLFVFVSLSVMIVLYTGADEIAGNRAPKWAARRCDSFNLNALFVFKTFDVYIKIPMKRDILFIYNYDIVMFIHMLSR